MKKELWLLSLSGSDSNLNDIGVKVPAGKTINVFKWNPYVTQEQVDESLKSGSIFKYLTAKKIKIVERKTAVRPADLDRIKESKEAVARKTKTSVVIESDLDDPEEGEGFEFADYGVNDVVSQKKIGVSVFVEAKQDEIVEPDSGVQLVPKEETGKNTKQTQIVMDMAEKSTHPAGLLAETTVASSTQPFVITKPPKQPSESKKEEPAVTKDPQKKATVSKKKSRSSKAIKKPKKVHSVPGDDEKGADSIIKFEDTSSGMKVATRTKDGAIVMELKEEEKVQKPKVVARKKRTKSSKKK